MGYSPVISAFLRFKEHVKKKEEAFKNIKNRRQTSDVNINRCQLCRQLVSWWQRTLQWQQQQHMELCVSNKSILLFESDACERENNHFGHIGRVFVFLSPD